MPKTALRHSDLFSPDTHIGVVGTLGYSNGTKEAEGE